MAVEPGETTSFGRLLRRHRETVGWIQAALDDAALVVLAIAQALDVRQSGGQPLHESIRLVVEARRILLLLDNVEHLLAAAVDVSALLTACPRLTVLATSRVALGVRGERQYPIEPLALPRLDHVPHVAEVESAAGQALTLDQAISDASRGMDHL